MNFPSSEEVKKADGILLKEWYRNLNVTNKQELIVLCEIFHRIYHVCGEDVAFDLFVERSKCIQHEARSQLNQDKKQDGSSLT